MCAESLENILILPSGFKESLTATQVAQAIKIGISKALPHASIRAIPIPDGGEHTAHILAHHTNGKIISKTVTGPLGQPIHAHFAMLGGSYAHVAVIEVAAAAGLKLIPFDQRNPMQTTSYGVGELIMCAINEGATKIILGCGDSGISDGGIGALQALGVKVTDHLHREIPYGGQYLQNVNQIDYSGLVAQLRYHQIDIILALNPFNILCGPQGVAPVFAPQKGASEQQVQQLSEGFEHWALSLKNNHINPISNFDFAYGMGTGASGGLGAGLAAIGAKLCPRFDVLLGKDLVGYDLDHEIRRADLIITAEGAIDCQTLRGKVPAEIAARAAKFNKPVIALAGTLAHDAECVYDIGIHAISSIMSSPMSLQEAIENSETLVIQASERLMKSVILGLKIAQVQKLAV
ncbi:glycerate kinase family protein [Acinetobacter indicus]|uniref:glycerate kinase family protein n=1 Tax=Acinetobacter indicus TaxID=756892 RepID=UPI000CEB8627|nr:glycerate kinase [Acinetobacter indicus]MDM1268734.1 glycerate kinase [Acinetobacter indicus]QIZ61382.1 glycerate kinase [Acinetobacter indicus]